ncbi:MAG: DUF3291 domain-containing protein [Granulosicoccus sp.]
MSQVLVQLNIATLVAPLDSPVLADFVADLDRINALAEQSPGFLWRLQSESGDATELEHGFGENVIVNMSVWESIEALHTYVYKTAHAKVMSRRKEWFERMTNAYSVLWWIPEGHRPTVGEAQLKLELLQSKGPGPDAFTFKASFPKPSGLESEQRQISAK